MVVSASVNDIRIDLGLLSRYLQGDIQDNTLEFSPIYVAPDRIEQDDQGRSICYMSDILPKATIFNSPLKSE